MRPILNADDYAMTQEVSRAIEELARDHRLSATSVMTSMPAWPQLAPRLRELRGHIATGLHLNLTLGSAATPSATLAPSGQFQSLGSLIKRAVTRRLEMAAIRAEIRHQLDLFERHLGYAPDHIDGHQHVHAFPVIRHVLIGEVRARYASTPPLIRIPVVTASGLTSRGIAGLKGLTVKALAAGFAGACRDNGLPVNRHFAGFSDFDPAKSFRDEIDAELRTASAGNGLSIVMCHPGYPDAELQRLDPIVGRRQDEVTALKETPDLAARIWHPERAANGPPIDWARLETTS